MTATAPDMEVEYNNRARVPEHPGIIEGWARDAADYRETGIHDLDIAYGPHARQRYDLFGRGDKNKTCIVFIHGGYWQALDKSFFSHMAAGANAADYDVAIPSYRLCPEVTVADIVDDMFAFCRSLGESGRRDIVVAGHSAGGHLAACLLARGTHGRSVVRAALPISGLFDLIPLVGTSINDALRLTDDEARRQSPLFWTPPATGTALVAYVGASEPSEYQRQSRTIADAWGNAGIHTSYRKLAGDNHFTAIASLARPDGELTRALLDLAAR
ncbi:MAG: alpha/beta hydrolase [Rhodobiaceae bacterium]|nr:alpha/beta hydrolase [Rhodobiaceae bacterium]MCC0055732.1 alpha/beta hydrolase [Rhodobiaceae bacterium]